MRTYDTLISKLESILRYKLHIIHFWKWETKSDMAVKSQMINSRKILPRVMGDEVVLQLASNLLEVDIHVISAFPSLHNNGVTIIKPVDFESQKQPIYLFLFPKSDFEPAHYQSVVPSFSLPLEFEVSEMFSFDNKLMFGKEITEESIRDVQVVVTDQPST